MILMGQILGFDEKNGGYMGSTQGHHHQALWGNH